MTDTQQDVALQQQKNASLAKHDSGTNEADFEVAQPMHITNSGDPMDERPGVDEKQPVIEQHITKIPQDDAGEADPSRSALSSSKQHSTLQKDGLSLRNKLKKHLPGYHSSVTAEDQPEKSAVNFNGEDLGSSDFEVAGFMPITTQGSSGSTETSNKQPHLERHISSIPQNDDDVDGEAGEGMAGKLRRKISNIAQNH